MTQQAKLTVWTVLLTFVSTLLLTGGLGASGGDPIEVGPDGKVTIGDLKAEKLTIGDQSLADYIKQLVREERVRDDHIKSIVKSEVDDERILKVIKTRCYFLKGWAGKDGNAPSIHYITRADGTEVLAYGRDNVILNHDRPAKYFAPFSYVIKDRVGGLYTDVSMNRVGLRITEPLDPGNVLFGDFICH